MAYQCSRIFDYGTNTWKETGITKEDLIGKKATDYIRATSVPIPE